VLEHMLSKEELEALLADRSEEQGASLPDSRLEGGEQDKLLHAVIRNQLRLLRMIDELRSEVNALRSQLGPAPAPRGVVEAAASVERVAPLPFMERRAEAEDDVPAGGQNSPTPLSRKEKYKRQSFW
jgi:hypothetical protein